VDVLFETGPIHISQIFIHIFPDYKDRNSER
jgi:hypothetical protein